jgi:uncharacterized protein (DUF1697 family)
MARQVAFLRAVNVGGRAIVRMTDVQKAFTDAGCANVTTFIASGNILFEAPLRRADPKVGDPKVGSALRTRIGANMQGLLGTAPVIVYRTMDQLQQLVARAPFGALAADRRLKLYVIFAATPTSQRPVFPLRLPKEGLECIGMVDDDVLVVSHRKPNGMYGFPNNWIERELRITSTARNWSTVRKLVALQRA